jgi:hypothetical protein
MLTLDHLAVACASLDEGTAWVQDRLGVTLQQGGQHPRYGTHNTLLGLADWLYLEVIAKEPHANPEAGHCWFDLDRFSGPPRLANWICQTDNTANAPSVAGPARALTRGDLSWQITVPDGGGLPYGGAFPTLIQWAEGTRHPAGRLASSGCKMLRLEVTHPDMKTISQMVSLDDPRITLSVGDFAMQATFETPHGIRTL